MGHASTNSERNLPDDPLILKRMNQELLQTVHQLRHENEQLSHRLDQLLRRLYGPRSEKLEGPGLFDHLEPPQASDPTPSSEPTPKPTPEPVPTRKPGHGRQKLAPQLRRQRIDHDFCETEKLCPCCQNPRVKIGEEVSEQLDYVPASLFVVEHHKAKYVCRSCEAKPPEERKTPDNLAVSTTHITAPLPPQPIDKAIAGPGLLSHIVTSKYADHLPLHRLEGILSRHGVEIARSTMSNWMAATALLLSVLHDRMLQRVLLSEVIHTDDTPVPVQDDTQRKTKTGRLWVYLGDTANRFAYFDYTPTHSRDGPQKILQGFSGYLQADAYRGYDAIYANGSIREVACWAHARRKFDEAKSSHSALAHTALGFIAQLYHLESGLKATTDSERVASRLSHALPILEQFRVWLVGQKSQVLPKSPLGQAIEYTLSNYDALMRYTEAGFLNIDNNLSERTLRLVAIGRKNWMFCGSDAGGKTASILFSFTATCKLLKIDPFVYLRELLTELPKLKTRTCEDLDFWLPDAWQKRHQSEVSISSN